MSQEFLRLAPDAGSSFAQIIGLERPLTLTL